jgi:hypothetical protein
VTKDFPRWRQMAQEMRPKLHGGGTAQSGRAIPWRMVTMAMLDESGVPQMAPELYGYLTSDDFDFYLTQRLWQERPKEAPFYADYVSLKTQKVGGVLSHEDTKGLCDRYGISVSTSYRWVRVCEDAIRDAVGQKLTENIQKSQEGQ